MFLNVVPKLTNFWLKSIYSALYVSFILHEISDMAHLRTEAFEILWFPLP